MFTAPTNPPAEPKAGPEKEGEAPDAPAEGDKPAVEPVKEAKEETPGKEEKSLPIRNLRNAYTEAKEKIKALEMELTTLKSSASKPGDIAPEVQAKIEEANQRAEQAESELRFVRYEKSSEYREKYLTPLKRAFEKGAGDATQIQITEEDGETRAGTPQDFEELCRMPLGQAKQAAKKFGDFADEMMAHRRKVLEIREEAGRAIEEYRDKGSEHEKQTAAQSQAAQVKATQRFNSLNTQAKEKYPEWFKPDEADPEGNKLLDWGYTLANRLFGDQSKLSDEERVSLHSAAYNQLAAFPRMAHRVKTLRARVAELEKALKQFEDSGPTGGSRKTKAGPLATSATSKNGKPLSPGMAEAFNELDQLAAGTRR